MKKILGFFTGFLILLMTFVMLYFASAIYDTNDRAHVEPFFLRDGTVSNMEVPKSMTEVENKKLQTWLIQKFVTEYFYVTPNIADIEKRQIKRSPLYYLSTPSVFKEWKDNIAPILTEMANKGERQTVHVFDEIVKIPDSNYLQVDYELKRWYKPNDMAEVPEVTRGTIYISVQHAGAAIKVKTPIKAVHKELIKGIDPAVVFVFRVDSVRVPGNN